MAEEVSPESKLYVKEEIEKMRKEFKEDLEKANSKATKTFATIAMIIGLLGSLGIYGLVKSALSDTAIKTLEEDAQKKYKSLVKHERDASESFNRIVKYEQQVGKFATKEELSNHKHTVTYSGKEIGTKYIKNQDRVNIPDGHIIVGAYADGGGTIFYYKKLEIEAPK
jgi:hypothetical protein